MTRTRCIIVSTCVIALLLLITPQLFAQANNCLQDEFTAAGNSQKLNCTANDVRVAQVTSVRDLNGAPLTTCIQGSTFSFIADFEIVTSSTSSRSNIGLYFASQGQANALTGSCVDNIISPSHQCPGAAAGIDCGSDNYHELDPQTPPDNCGDTSSTDNSPVFGAAAEGVTIVVSNFLCQAPAGSSTLVLPNCTSWQVPGKTLTCFSPSPSFPYETSAIPGSPSKCNCGTIPLPITPVTPTAKIGKACNTTITNTSPTFDFTGNTGQGSPSSCDAGVEGSTVTYTVKIENTTNIGGITLEQVCDSAYGQVYPATGSCSTAGTVGTIVAGSFSCDTFTLAQGGFATCTFQANVGELASVSDVVTASGHSVVSTSKAWSAQSNSVTVISEDAPSTVTVTKGLVSNTNACITVRYSADVKNTSGFDENLTLTGLQDNAFGSITTTHGDAGTNNSILGTTCGVATTSSGLGTLSGSSGAGTFPATLSVGGSDYACQFDGVICAAVGTVNLPGGGTCQGISHTNTVSTNTIHGDEGATDPVTETDHGLTVNECVTVNTVSN